MTRKLNFGTKAARSGKATSMVIFVHGYGADGGGPLGLADPLASHLPDTVFFSPDAPEPCRGNPFGRQWFPIPRLDGSSLSEAEAGLGAAASDLNAFIDERLAETGLAPDRLVLVGFSQGSMMSLHVAPRRAKAVAGVVAFSGRLIAPERLVADAVVRPPMLLIHGDQDQMVEFGEMSLAADALVQNGFEVFGHVMKGTGHGIAPDGLQVALSFLMQQLG